MTTTVRPVAGGRDLRAFIEFPYRHYAGHPTGSRRCVTTSGGC